MATAELQRDIEIDACPDAVWSVLADTPRYAEWNPFIRRLSGDLREGSKIETQIAPPQGRAMRFTPTVLRATPGRELRWLGRLFIPRLLDGEHTFKLEPLDDGRTRFVQRERFSGLLVRFAGKALDNTATGFEQMNAALRHEVETRTAAHG